MQSWQEGRKCDEVFHFFSPDAFLKVREYCNSLKTKEEEVGFNDIDPLLRVGDYYQISFSSELLQEKVVYNNGTGYLKAKVIKTYRWEDEKSLAIEELQSMNQSSGSAGVFPPDFIKIELEESAEILMVQMKDIYIPYL